MSRPCEDRLCKAWRLHDEQSHPGQLAPACKAEDPFVTHRVQCLVLLLLSTLTATACALQPSPWIEQYGRTVWHTENGLPQNTVRAIAQTQDGYLWLGTEDGLVRFNGTDFVVFNAANTPQMQSNNVQSLLQGHSGDLWVSTANGLLLYRAHRFLRLDQASGLPSAVVYFVSEDLSGNVWVSTAGGLCLLHADHCTPVAEGFAVHSASLFVVAPDGSAWAASGSQLLHLHAPATAHPEVFQTPGDAEIIGLALDRGGNLFVGTTEGLASESSGSLTPIAILGAEQQPGVFALLPEPDGTLWIGTAHGLAHGKGRDFALLSSPGPIQVGWVENLFHDRQGTLWIATRRGLLRLAQGRLSAFRPGDPLSSGPILSHLEDREGTLWLGTEFDGLTALRQQAFTTYSTRNGLSADGVRAVLQDAQGTLWIGTDGGGLDQQTSNGFRPFTTADGLSSNVILSLASAPNGDLWVGTPAGLDLIRHGKIQAFTASSGLVDDFIRSLCVDARGVLWIGTRNGLMRFEANKFTSFSTLDGLGGDLIGSIVQRRNGDLLIATSGGLTVGRKGQFKTFTTRDGLPSDVITAIYEDPQGTVWLGTNGSGLARLDDKRISTLPSPLLPKIIDGLLGDSEGNLWISARTGLFRVPLRTLQGPSPSNPQPASVKLYDAADGIRIGEGSAGGHPAAFRMRDGTLWFATSRGVSMTDPAALPQGHPPPPVALEDVLVDGILAPQDGSPTNLNLDPGKHRVEFRYTALSFAAPQKVRYRYMLVGFDRDWVDAGRQRAAFYTNLPPGRYTFRVAATLDPGVWGETQASSTLRIRPFLYQRPWFYILLAFVLAGASYLIYWWRVRRVEAVFASVLAERNRIAREIHDTLAQGIVSISLQLEVLSRLMPISQERASEHLEAAKGMVRQTLADARSSIWELRSTGTETDELPARVGKLLRQLTENAPAELHYEVSGTYRPLSPSVENDLLRILQEATINALRHAQCKHIRVSILYSMKALSLQVSDDGIGLGKAAETPGSMGHFGLQGMRERAARIKAGLHISAAPHGGTIVALELILS